MAKKKRKRKNRRAENRRRLSEKNRIKGLSRSAKPAKRDEVIAVEVAKEEQKQQSEITQVKRGLILDAGQISEREIRLMMQKYELPGSKKMP